MKAEGKRVIEWWEDPGILNGGVGGGVATMGSKWKVHNTVKNF